MSTHLHRIRRAWSDHVVGPTLQTYDAACEELGGAPWRPLEATDSWFLDKPDSANGSAKLPALDTGALSLKRPMSDRTKLAVLGGGALVVIALCLVALTGGAAAHPSVAAATPIPPVAAPAAPIKVAQAAPAPVEKKTSPSVRALFGSASTARPHAVANRHVARHQRR